MAYGVALKHISITKLGALNIVVPPIERQNLFASFVEMVCSLKRKQNDVNSEINVLFDALMQKAFNGELSSG